MHNGSLTITQSDLTRLTQGLALKNKTLDQIIEKRLRKQFDEQVWHQNVEIEQQHNQYEFSLESGSVNYKFLLLNVWVILSLVLVLSWVFQVGGFWSDKESRKNGRKRGQGHSDKRRDSMF